MKRIIFHIDVNNAFLSWTAVELLEQGYKYDIRNSYAVIGGDESARKGIVLAKSMPAKKMGIKTADTLFSARKRCPALRVYKPNYKMYQEKFHRMFRMHVLYVHFPEALFRSEFVLLYVRKSQPFFCKAHKATPCCHILF